MPDDPHSQTEGSRGDEELIRGARMGSSSDFGAIVDRYGGRLLRFLIGRCGDRHTAEDLVQETFVRAWQSIDSFDGRWKLSTWLYTIASNLAIDHFRRKRPARLSDRPLAAPPADPGARLAATDAAEGIWQTAGRLLPEAQHAALVLRYSEELEIAQIAEILGKSQANVRVLLHRARTTLATATQSAETARRPAPGEPAPRGPRAPEVTL